MTQEIKMPRWGITMEEGMISSFSVQIGDTIHEGQEVCQVETEKVIQPVESLFSGVVEEFLCAVNDTIPVGGSILRIRCAE